jgi:2-phospho-L-lactate guanylyltransferase (CobY/MobA/RfbA family)
LLAAQRAGVTPAIIHHPALAFDVDDAADLATLGIWAGRNWARRCPVVSS